jgi:hypothetical protein
MTVHKGRVAAAGGGLMIAVLAIASFAWPTQDAAKRPLGLFTSLPIYWNERASVNEALDEGGEPHWVRTRLESDYRLIPLDSLDGGELAKSDALVMAQPRPLAPQENVALDAWVRRGGHLLLFADPFLTEPSRFALGDKRRPQDVVLLSPILARWGLQLTFDDRQSDGERVVRYRSVPLPERLAGRLRVVEPGAPARCSLAAEGLLAQCAIGKGRVLVMADAAILEADRAPKSAEPGLAVLLTSAFGR